VLWTNKAHLIAIVEVLVACMILSMRDFIGGASCNDRFDLAQVLDSIRLFYSMADSGKLDFTSM